MIYLQDMAQRKLYKVKAEHPEWMPARQLYSAGWNGNGEWTCAKCATQIGKNLYGDMPFGLAQEHSEKCQD